MRKTAEKSNAAGSLGTKRTCPKCGTKFYDFNKDVLVCPKCEAKVDPDSTKVYKAPETKKPKPKEGPEAALLESEDIVVGGGEEAFESVEDLDDDEDEIVEDLEVDGEEGSDF